MTTLIVMLLLLFTAIIILVQLGVIPNVFKSLRTCADRGGVCNSKLGGCAETEIPLYDVDCGKGNICCLPEDRELDKLSKFTSKEREAVYNAIILTLNQDPTPIMHGRTLDLKVDTEYTFHIKINDKLPESKIGPCAVYVTDAREDGKKYLLSKDGGKLITAGDGINQEGKPMEFGDCKKLAEKKYKPELFDAYKDLVLYVILFDEEVKKEFAANANTLKLSENLIAMYSNTDHWLAYRAYRLNVEPVVKISGMSGAWVKEDKITISCTIGTCTKFGLKLVKSDEGNYSKILKECTGSDKGKFEYVLEYIAGTTIKTTGIPLNLDIGGFRLQKQKVLYLTEKKPITVVNNKAEVTIDKATMINNFYKSSNNEQLFVGDSTYLCVRAETEGGGVVFGLSETPLRVDIIPPYINAKDGIKLIYPDPVEGIMPGASEQTTPYYYRQYPRVVIANCYDFGQSGCSNYDYYIHTGNFVNLRSYTTDLETGITALLLTQGLNALLNYLAAQNPLNTICPYIHSNNYRRNTHPEIRFRDQGQGVMCIRASDKVGNAELYWKGLWTPENMFRNILAQEAGKFVSGVGG